MTVDKNSKPSFISAITTILLVIATVYLTIVLGNNHRLNDNLNKAKLSIETSLSERLALEKKIVKLQATVNSTEKQKNALQTTLDQANNTLQQQALAFDNMALTATLTANVKKKNADLESQKQKLQTEISKYHSLLTSLRQDDSAKTKTIAANQLEKSNLLNEIETLKRNHMIETRVELRKRNDALTIQARKTKKICVTVSVPEGIEELRFQIIDSKGTELLTSESHVAIKTIQEEITPPNSLYATISNKNSGVQHAYKKIQMIYEPRDKLTPGVYTIVISTNNSSIGSLQTILK